MKIPWSFALPLLLGIGSAVFLFARIMVALLETYADIVWAFFFGLILSSLFILLAEIKKKNPIKHYFRPLLFCRRAFRPLARLRNAPFP